MARLEWVIITERTLIEQSNVVSLVGIVENINIEPLGAPPPAGQKVALPFRFYVNQQWVRSRPDRGERLEGRLLLSGPKSKKPYLVVPFEVNLEATQRARLITHLMGFPALGQGEYPAVVQVRQGKRWRTAGRTQFNVLVKAETVPPKRARH